MSGKASMRYSQEYKIKTTFTLGNQSMHLFTYTLCVSIYAKVNMRLFSNGSISQLLLKL